MRTSNRFRGLRAALIGMAIAGSTAVARADINNYEFQLVEQSVEAGPDAVIAVRLVNKTTGTLVPDAVIFATRLDMAPDGMATMTSNLERLPPAEPGIYRFKTMLGMEGRWQLSLAAKVQGLRETVQSRLVLEASN